MNSHVLAPSGVAGLAQAIVEAPRIAVDTEFHAEHRWLPELWLVQIAIPGGDAWIVDPKVPGLIEGLAPALRGTPWLVHGGEQDLKLLERALGGVPETVFDTQIAAGLVDTWFPSTFASLVRTWVGRDIDKSETLSDWSQRPLSRAQLEYAAADVQLLLPLADRLDAELASLGRTEAARAACAEAVTAALEPRDEDVFRSLTASAILEGVHLAVLQALAAWREARARDTDQPPRSVLSDGLLLDLARRLPTSPGTVTANRNAPRRMARHAEEIAHLIARVLASDPSAWPTAVHRTSPAARRSSWLQLWAQVVGQDARWAQPLVLPRTLADRLSQEASLDRETLCAMLGWRDPLIGAALDDALKGGTGLHLTVEGGVVARG
ncbi:MAG: HRDC domain-containing protein [Alphaproteobacteria bacterium]|nr:HRDC domain-containing protein [Alphaproteobacteria bacterium]MCB9696205.1 HRDC domain-containing protein [Alphaproteobacteria bacterium]